MREKHHDRTGAQARFLHGHITSEFLQDTGIQGLAEPVAPGRNWTTPVCRVISRLFGCGKRQPITRSPFCKTEP